jgi:hypothetical protein
VTPAVYHRTGKKARKTYGIPRHSVLKIAKVDSTCLFLAFFPVLVEHCGSSLVLGAVQVPVDDGGVVNPRYYKFPLEPTIPRRTFGSHSAVW